ncbi:hypothetical protein J1605_000002 [Eschrichtius robustus]|uniref:Uncharacterized protein n=1 Tax=Eschrichtius robustus TaxID=9764 RepID=A0AB34I769_ESCRO|nr:hypothetical protein J1605_000002 [Eschrichtius robustus]
MGLVVLLHVGSSRTRARTRVPCIGRRILKHSTTREVPYRPYLVFKMTPCRDWHQPHFTASTPPMSLTLCLPLWDAAFWPVLFSKIQPFGNSLREESIPGVKSWPTSDTPSVPSITFVVALVGICARLGRVLA